jgi:quercetin dioxygenase-like cupin family protein
MTPSSCIIEDQPKPGWTPVPRKGVRGVEFRVLLSRDGILVANLRFASDATIDRHSAPHDIDVICIAGAGYTSVGDDVSVIEAGQTVRWPRDVDHCLWTDGRYMETIMVERYGV